MLGQEWEELRKQWCYMFFNFILICVVILRCCLSGFVEVSLLGTKKCA